MANDKKDTAAKDAAKDAEERAEAQGRTLQEQEKADLSGDPKAIEDAAESENPPEANPDTEGKPAADANPDEVMGQGDSWPNMISSRGLNARQKARVEGTPLDGQLGGAVLNPAQTVTPTRDERRRESDKEAAKKGR